MPCGSSPNCRNWCAFILIVLDSDILAFYTVIAPLTLNSDTFKKPQVKPSISDLLTRPTVKCFTPCGTDSAPLSSVHDRKSGEVINAYW